ncbi:hypothetical protein D3C84_734450 [compost metagenome]
MGIEAADHITAAMEIQHHRLQSFDRLPFAIQARRQAMTVACSEGEVVAGNTVQRHIEKPRRRFKIDPRLLRRLFMHRATFAGHPAELREFEKCFKFWQYGHGKILLHK